MTELYLYASEMWRARNCPGSVKATRKERSATRGGTGEAQYGYELHRMTEEVIGGKLKVEAIDEPERGYIERCISFLKGRDIVGETESPLFLLVKGELIASCRADLLHVNKKAREVVIPDWKFYRAPLEPDEWGWQAFTMCAAALQEHKDCDTAVAIAYLPVLDMTYERVLFRHLLEETTLEIYETYQAANQTRPALNPGAWCARCEHLAGCPAAQGVMSDIAVAADLEAIRTPGKPPTVALMRQHFYSEIEKWSRGRFLGYLKALPFLRPLLEALTDRLRRELAQGISHTSWELSEKNKPRKGSVRALRKALGDLFSYDEIDDLCAPAFTRVTKALKRRGLSEEEIAKRLEPFDQGKTDSLRRIYEDARIPDRRQV